MLTDAKHMTKYLCDHGKTENIESFCLSSEISDTNKWITWRQALVLSQKLKINSKAGCGSNLQSSTISLLCVV